MLCFFKDPFVHYFLYQGKAILASKGLHWKFFPSPCNLGEVLPGCMRFNKQTSKLTVKSMVSNIGQFRYIYCNIVLGFEVPHTILKPYNIGGYCDTHEIDTKPLAGYWDFKSCCKLPLLGVVVGLQKQSNLTPMQWELRLKRKPNITCPPSLIHTNFQSVSYKLEVL